MADEWMHKAAVEIAQEVDEVSASLKGPRFMFEEFIESVEKKIASHAPSSPSEHDLYAAYANHCAIQKQIPMTVHSWRKAGCPHAPEENRVKSTEELQKELEHLQFAADNKGVEVNQSRPPQPAVQTFEECCSWCNVMQSQHVGPGFGHPFKKRRKK